MTKLDIMSDSATAAATGVLLFLWW